MSPLAQLKEIKNPSIKYPYPKKKLSPYPQFVLLGRKTRKGPPLVFQALGGCNFEYKQEGEIFFFW